MEGTANEAKSRIAVEFWESADAELESKRENTKIRMICGLAMACFSSVSFNNQMFADRMFAGAGAVPEYFCNHGSR